MVKEENTAEMLQIEEKYTISKKHFNVMHKVSSTRWQCDMFFYQALHKSKLISSLIIKTMDHDLVIFCHCKSITDGRGATEDDTHSRCAQVI